VEAGEASSTQAAERHDNNTIVARRSLPFIGCHQEEHPQAVEQSIIIKTAAEEDLLFSPVSQQYYN